MNGSMLITLTSVGYFLEILVAELLFLSAYKRKKFFILRFALSLIVAIPLVLQIDFYSTSSTLGRFIFLLIIIGITAVISIVSFEGDSFSMISSCINGVATQHIANKLTLMITLIPFVKEAASSNYIFSIALEIIICSIVYIIVFICSSS